METVSIPEAVFNVITMEDGACMLVATVASKVPGAFMDNGQGKMEPVVVAFRRYQFGPMPRGTADQLGRALQGRQIVTPGLVG